MCSERARPIPSAPKLSAVRRRIDGLGIGADLDPARGVGPAEQLAHRAADMRLAERQRADDRRCRRCHRWSCGRRRGTPGRRCGRSSRRGSTLSVRTPATQGLPVMRATTPAWLVMPPRAVRMPVAAFMPSMSVGPVSVTTRMQCRPRAFSRAASSGVKTISPLAAPGDTPRPVAIGVASERDRRRGCSNCCSRAGSMCATASRADQMPRAHAVDRRLELGGGGRLHGRAESSRTRSPSIATVAHMCWPATRVEHSSEVVDRVGAATAATRRRAAPARARRSARRASGNGRSRPRRAPG